MDDEITHTTSAPRGPHHVDRSVDDDHEPLLRISADGDDCATCGRPVEVAES